jgi:hypothetical protein
MASGEVLVDRGELRPVGLDIDVDVDVENVERAEQDCWRRIFAGPVECTEVERTGSRLVQCSRPVVGTEPGTYPRQ